MSEVSTRESQVREASSSQEEEEGGGGAEASSRIHRIKGDKVVLPALVRALTPPLASEPPSMPLIEKEFKHGQAITEYNLPSAIDHSKSEAEDEREPKTSVRPSSSQLSELVKRRSELKFISEGQIPPAITATDPDEGCEILHEPENPSTGSASTISSAGGDPNGHGFAIEVAIELKPVGSGGETAKLQTERNHAWHGPSNGESHATGSSKSLSEENLTIEPPLTPPKDRTASGSIRSPGPHKRTSYIGPRAPPIASVNTNAVGATDEIESYTFGPKKQNAGGNGDASQSYSRSISRFLTSSGGAISSPRIHPVAYSPSFVGGHDEDDDDNTDNRSEREGRSRQSTPKHAGTPKQSHPSSRSAVNAGRGGPTAALATQIVQIAAAEVVQPPSPVHGYQRSVFVRTQSVIADIFGQPIESHTMKMANRAVFVLILLNFCMMASETCEGKNFAGSDPGYPYLPGEQTYKSMDALISVLFTLELFGRVTAQKFQKAILLDPFTIADFVALVPWYFQLLLNVSGASDFNLDNMDSAGHPIALLRLLRAVRLGNILRNYDQTRILYLSIRASLRPLGITMFFLFTLVMLLATALFYAEPCYNIHTRQFTDIFNSAYFIMVTVATVGYGNQVPSLSNWVSVFVTGVAMISGQMYFSMPVFIVGNNFQSTYENFQWNNKRKLRQLDETLSPFDVQEMHAYTQQLTNTQFHLLEAWRIVQLNIQKMVRKSKMDDADSKEAAHAQAQRLAKIKEVTEKLLGVHTEACGLLQHFVPHKKKERRGSGPEVRSEGMLSHIYVRARRAMAKPKGLDGANMDSRDASAMTESFRGRLWLALEVPDSSQAAMAINKIMVVFALLSVFLFCCESLPELATSGVETPACRRVVYDYCIKTGFKDTRWTGPDAGCFARDVNGKTNFSQQLDFTCTSPTKSPSCYANGLNFGSLDASAPSCVDVFDTVGVSIICYRQQCNKYDTIVDMGPYWIYFEWMFGLAFMLELVLRFVASRDRARLIRDFYIIFDILAIVPFFVEVIQYLVQNVEPTYAIVATSPSFLSVIRVLKTMRILKLTRHFKGTKVLASTAKGVWKQLTIPIFFLFTGCILAGAFFYEIERGTECFVGQECLWWHKDVLTPRLAAHLPEGKRILIQDRRPATIIDMIKSTWLSYTTLTAVEYGDLVPRTSIGKVFCICVVIISTIYSAMPVSLVGSKFYELYEKHMEKMVVKRGGSSASWRGTKRNLMALVDLSHPNSKQQQQQQQQQPSIAPSPRTIELFALTEKELDVLHQFVSMRRTLVNLQRNLDNFGSLGIDIALQRKDSNAGENVIPSLAIRKTDNLEQSIEYKSNAIMDTLLQFSLVIEKIQEAPATYEALIDDPLQSLVVGKVFQAMKKQN